MCFIPSGDVSLGPFRGSGMTADVYEGELVHQARNDTTRVAVKRFKVVLGKEEQFAKVPINLPSAPNSHLTDQ